MVAKKRSKIIATIIAFMMVFAMIPQLATPVHAAGPDGMVLGTDILADGANTENAQTVYMADKAWKVIGYNGAGVASNTDTMTLISARNISKIQFRADRNAPDANHYSKSNLKTEVDAIAETFSACEKSGIVARDLVSGTHDWLNERELDCIAGDEVNGALLWPLSTKEALAMDCNLRRLETNTWWLRSPTCYNHTAGIMNGSENPDGNYYGNGITVNNYDGLRPAFNYNLKSVVFTSAATGGKSSGDLNATGVNPNAMTAVETNTDNEWKLTLNDDGSANSVGNGHEGFSVDSVDTSASNKVTISYSGAATGNNEFISAIITTSEGKISYYGRVKNATSAQGTATIDIGGKLGCNDKLYVFNERYNGDGRTDYTSALHEINGVMGHEIFSWECIDDDHHKITCSRCRESFTVDHTWDGGTVTDPATCTENGKKLYTCTGCRKTKEEVINAGHDYGEWTSISDTQHERICSLDPAHVETANHSWDAGTVKKPATCYNTGTMLYTCTVCKGTKEETININQNGHQYGAWTNLNTTQHQRVCEHNSNHVEKANHTWDAGKVTKQATTAATGVKTYTCTTCKGTKTESIPKLQDQKGSDGTAVGPGASSQAAEKAITTLKKEADPKGAVFARIQLKSPSQTKSSVKISWKKTSGATKYVIYGNACGTKNKMKNLATVTGTSKNFTKVAGKKVKKGTYYKFMVVALDKNNKVVSTSKMIHVATKGGKVGNNKSVTVKAKIGGKTKAVSKVTLKKGKTLTLKTTLNPVSKKTPVKKHVGVRYESSNSKIATVNGTGKITAKAKGTCYIYAYAQNGVMKAIKLTVK